MNFFSSYVSPRAVEYVKRVLDSGMLSEGDWTREFERKIENFHGYERGSVVATNSGTSALHLALKTLGVGEGDEVIIPPLTFVATGLAVLYCGAKVVFADILEDGTIDPDQIKKLVTVKTKAIIAVNWVGKEFDPRLYDVAIFYGIKLIVDAAQDFPYLHDADAVCFSFQATKHVSTGDGGAVYFKHQHNTERAKRLAWFGIDKDLNNPDILGERVYDLYDVGFKYHMNNLSAAVGVANVEDVGETLHRRREIATAYNNELYSVNSVHPDGSSWWAYPILVDDVRRFSIFCEQVKVPCSIIHRGIDRNQVFGNKHPLPMMREWERTVTHLPVHMELTDEDVDFICEKVNEYV